MLKLKKKLKSKFKSSKIECLPSDDFSVLSFELDGMGNSPAPPPTASEPSSSSSLSLSPVMPSSPRRLISRNVQPSERHPTGPSPGCQSGQNSTSMSYSCCYNYNFNINYNFSPPPPPSCETACDGMNSPKWCDEEIFEELTRFDSNSQLTSEQSGDQPKKPHYQRKVRPMSTDRSKRSTSSMSSKVTPGNPRLLKATMKPARCLSTSDLSTYKGSMIGEANHDMQNICNRLHSSKITEMLDQKGTQLTDHDRRILHCMVLKRIKEIERLEESVVAKQCWEQEKHYRKSLLDQQERNYKKAIKQKRSIEEIEKSQRKQRLARLEQQQIERIQNEICQKDIRSTNLLKTLEIKKGIKECEKKNRELKRIEDATVNQEEKILDKDIWRQSLADHMEERVQRAEEIRHRVLTVYRQRVRIDNQLERNMHAQNLKQTLEQERFKLIQLQERILARESRFQKFKDSKKRIFDQLKNRAKATAALRDMVKLSISPDACAKVIVPNQHRMVNVVHVK
ncbi:uncharacterized protein LOC129760472 [Uranotaenia lowii]|uniref:uncharacterized protein LOC129760472 n=1 Tax=Uranotaenia lowii TaxID=190385 RepID=UPI00247A7782|nr:uncharacterized protein LOC129760472 [Uranotaenia lowii]